MNSTKLEITTVINHLNSIFTKQFKTNSRNGYIYLDIYAGEQMVKQGVISEKSEKRFLLSLQIFKSGVNFTLDNK